MASSLCRGRRPLLVGIGSHTIVLPQRFTFPRLFLLLVRRWLSNGELCPQSPPPLINNTASRIQFVPKTSKHTVHLGGILLLVLCMVISSPVYTFLFSFSTRDNSRLRLPSLPSHPIVCMHVGAHETLGLERQLVSSSWNAEHGEHGARILSLEPSIPIFSSRSIPQLLANGCLDTLCDFWLPRHYSW
ncbi:hypothetical protein BS47DRAFT_1056861 [Hydnum rufescens UP504]|uniref:Uncharacterized protein n=1 Tax=Hydnum rufescens UP504 TaxID=1448309 RepID=A0A9P6AVH7_9AGAM|nr:hypothetical protein BS47DRAFT_1056861 [Hydnum rufescens UP504]